MNKLKQYFDLHSKPKRGARAQFAHASPAEPKAWPQWIALLLGVLVQPFLEEYRSKGHWNFTLGWEWPLFAVIVAVVIFPSVYRAAFDSEKPWLVQIAPIFTAGLGWQALFGTAIKAVAQVGGKGAPSGSAMGAIFQLVLPS